jgi:hypothetical protein
VPPPLHTAFLTHNDAQMAMFNSVLSYMKEETELVRRVQAQFRSVGLHDLFEVLDEDDSGSISRKEVLLRARARAATFGFLTPARAPLASPPPSPPSV